MGFWVRVRVRSTVWIRVRIAVRVRVRIRAKVRVTVRVRVLELELGGYDTLPTSDPPRLRFGLRIDKSCLSLKSRTQ